MDFGSSAAHVQGKLKSVFMEFIHNIILPTFSYNVNLRYNICTIYLQSNPDKLTATGLQSTGIENMFFMTKHCETTVLLPGSNLTENIQVLDIILKTANKEKQFFFYIK